MKYWMVKQEPEAYSFDQLLKDKTADWTGIRNFQARNNLREMRVGDKVLFYHSVSEKAVVGLAEVSREAFTDATDAEGKWIAVEIRAVGKLEKPVSLDEIKRNPDLQNIALIKQSRLSVIPLSEIEFKTIIELTEK
ncbi:MAG TPA: EVE domain-containing protein [Pyrinomonadaceae bacterium]|jgi:predicted RNA-binding protein with PUA-like domain